METEAFDARVTDSDMVDSGSEEEDSDDRDSDWEQEGGDYNTVTEYNTLQLRRFSRECDRYKQSNRAGAKTANALLKDLGIVTKTDQKFLVFPNKDSPDG